MTLPMVYDTNVIVSAALKPVSIPAALVSLALARRVQLYVSPPILAEYTAVLHRPKFGLETSSVEAFLDDLVQAAVTVYPSTSLAVASDEADNRFLECALAAQAAFLVTGHLRHFPAAFQDIRILEPARFAQALVERLTL
jgi:uncharacterized protein